MAVGAARDSERLGRAKDFIADEQWARAMTELRAALNDPREKSKDEALYWLAHSQNQSGDPAAAIDTIRRLEREYPASLWVKPAGSLRIDIAVHLQRNDVLWWTAMRPAASAPPPHRRARRRHRRRRAWPAPSPPAPPAPMLAPTPPPPPTPVPRTGTTACAVISTRPPAAWLPEVYQPDTDLRIQALGSLIQIDACGRSRILRGIALDDRATRVRRAGRSSCSRSRASPRRGQPCPGGAELAAEPCPHCGGARAGPCSRGPRSSGQLMQVYASADTPGEAAGGDRRSASGPSATRSSGLPRARRTSRSRQQAIVTLGQAGGGEQLQQLYAQAPVAVKRPIILALFNARADDALIRIAEREQDPALRRRSCSRGCGCFGTDKAQVSIC